MIHSFVLRERQPCLGATCNSSDTRKYSRQPPTNTLTGGKLGTVEGMPPVRGIGDGLSIPDHHRDFDLSKTTCGSVAAYTVVPTYSETSSTVKLDIAATSFQEDTVLGRQELATLWWMHCPNQCQAHLRNKQCRKFCKPIHRIVGVLSRKMISLQHNQVTIHDECRFPNLVQVSRSNKLFHLSFGDKDQVWMKFCVSVQAGALQPSSNRNKHSSWTSPKSRESVSLLDETRGQQSKSSVATVSPSPNSKYSSADWSHPSAQGVGDEKLPAAVTPRTTKRQRQDDEWRDGSQESASSDGSGCKRRLFETQQAVADQIIEASSQGSKQAIGIRPLRLWPNSKNAGSLLWPNSNNTDSSSVLALPMPREESGRSESLREETPIEWPVESGSKRYCADLALSDWKTMQTGKGMFKSAMVDLIVSRNTDKPQFNSVEEDCVWIPSLLAKTKVNE
jgi:hypothetical protein